MKVYVIEMLRWSDRENHSYIANVCTSYKKAIEKAIEKIRFRGGKYGAEVRGYDLEISDSIPFLKISIPCDDVEYFEKLLDK
jgi:hypothetical protein